MTSSGESRSKHELFGIRVLLAEDSIDNEALIQAYLKPTGAMLEVVRNGRDAVEIAKQNEFDVILMGIQMPCMDGLQATRELRQGQYDRPIVALSAMLCARRSSSRSRRAVSLTSRSPSRAKL